MKFFIESLKSFDSLKILLVVAFCVSTLCLADNKEAFAWNVMYTNNDGKLETAYIQCENGKQFALSRWVYKDADRYKRLWTWDPGKSMGNSNSPHLGKCDQNGHYDLGVKASHFCSCIGSR